MTQMPAPRSCSQFIDGFIFDLSHPFTRQAKFFANIFQRHWMFHAYAEIQLHHVFLTLGKRGK